MLSQFNKDLVSFLLLKACFDMTVRELFFMQGCRLPIYVILKIAANQIFFPHTSSLYYCGPIEYKSVGPFIYLPTMAGCGVIRGRIQNQKGLWLKIHCSQMKLPNLENWSICELSKSAKFDFQSQFSMSKITRIFLIFFHLRLQTLEHIFFIDIF